jgi:hypothetical protein
MLHGPKPYFTDKLFHQQSLTDSMATTLADWVIFSHRIHDSVSKLHFQGKKISQNGSII